VDAESRDNRYLHAILFDYGRVRASRRDPSRLLRDYVVRVEPGSDDLLLGKAYLALGPFRAPLGFFVLERRPGWTPLGRSLSKAANGGESVGRRELRR